MAFAVGDPCSLSPPRCMGNACASTTPPGPTASTAPRSTTTSPGRLPTAKPEPPKSVSVSSQSGIVSPDPLPHWNASSMCAFLPWVQEAAHPEVVGRCFPSSSVNEEPLPCPCPAPTTCLCGKDSPVCTAPHLEILSRPWCLLPFSGTRVHTLGIRSIAVGSLPGYLGDDKGPDLSSPWTPLTNAFAGGVIFCCWMWTLLSPGTEGRRSHGLWSSAVAGRTLRVSPGSRGMQRSWVHLLQ